MERQTRPYCHVNGELDEVYLVYTKMENSFSMNAEKQKLLPLAKEDFIHPAPADIYQEEIKVESSMEEILEHVVPNCVTGYIYGALVESFASEHNSRMMAMQTATDSARSMISQLSIEYNRVRQAAITQQITEVIGGAKAQKNKKKKYLSRDNKSRHQRYTSDVFEMAIAIIGGLIYGTILTLIVIPCIYDAFNKEKSMVEEEL